MDRTRTFSWSDPGAVEQNLRRLPGVEFLKKVASGELPSPPMAHLMNIRITEVERVYAYGSSTCLIRRKPSAS
jgi:hypothetical protein